MGRAETRPIYLSRDEKQAVNVEQCIRLMSKYTQIEKLTPTLVNERFVL